MYGDCHECRCELYNPPGGLKGIPIHALFAFKEDEFRFVSCAQCGRFHVLPDGICKACGWDNDNNGMVERTRPDYCFHSPTRKHVVPDLMPSVQTNYCRYCLKTIHADGVKRHENVMRYWKLRSNCTDSRSDRICVPRNESRLNQMREQFTPDMLTQIESALKEYCEIVMASDLTLRSQEAYIDHATNFVRWLRGEFDPGARKNPYPLRRKPSAVA